MKLYRASRCRAKTALRFCNAIGIAMVIGLALSSCTFRGASPYPEQAGLFSWNPLVVNEGSDQLFEIMGELDLDSLYQEFSLDETSANQLTAFLDDAQSDGIEVYYLNGDPHWGLDPEGRSLCDAVMEAVSINTIAASDDEDSGNARLKGVVLDAEPFILDEWDEDPDGVMESFISGSEKAYNLAKEYGLEVIICIPYYYEEETSPQLLEDLLSRCCDQVAVMNYYRGSEIENIAEEVEIAQKEGKGIITIYELQEPNDYYSVEEVNTYWNEGIDAVERNYAEVQRAYPGQTISLALHDYGALSDLLKR